MSKLIDYVPYIALSIKSILEDVEQGKEIDADGERIPPFRNIEELTERLRVMHFLERYKKDLAYIALCFDEDKKSYSGAVVWGPVSVKKSVKKRR